MKIYEKPTCEVIELRNEENIAKHKSCQTHWLTNTNAGNQHCYKTSGS